MRYLTILALMPALLTACAEFDARSRNYTEPQDGATARVRFVTNGGLHLIPGYSCKKWSAEGSGALISNTSGASKIYKDRAIGMPGATPKDFIWSEVKVPANKPLTVVFSSLSPGEASCDYSWAFIPKAGEDYEVRVWHELVPGGGGFCHFNPQSLTHPSQRVPAALASDC